jgi:hypothetical protein
MNANKIHSRGPESFLKPRLSIGSLGMRVKLAILIPGRSTNFSELVLVEMIVQARNTHWAPLLLRVL